MSYAETALPPAKKRRFFVEPSPVAETFEAASSSPPQNQDAGHDIGTLSEKSNQGPLEGDIPRRVVPQATGGFDAATLEGIVAEKLDADAIRRLREASGDNMERGRYSRCCK